MPLAHNAVSVGTAARQCFGVRQYFRRICSSLPARLGATTGGMDSNKIDLNTNFIVLSGLIRIDKSLSTDQSRLYQKSLQISLCLRLPLLTALKTEVTVIFTEGENL